MSEQNILNPSATSLLNPDWGYTEGLPEMRSLFQAMSGKMYARRQMGRGRIYDLAWNNRDLATKHTLQQWADQYENDFFSLADWERGRYFSGRFEGPLTFNPVGNQKYNIRGRFIELPGPTLFSQPTNWARDAIFVEESNGFGELLVKLTGTWAQNTLNSPHGGADYISSTTNDIAEWTYFGYGFRYWARTNPNHGIVEVSCTRIRDGFLMLLQNVDLYSAGGGAPAALLDSNAFFSFPLDTYRVKLRVTGTKNISSSAFFCIADALQVMR